MFSKQPSPIDVTLEGTTIYLIFEQPVKAKLPIFSIPCGIITDSITEQFLKAALAISLTSNPSIFVGISTFFCFFNKSLGEILIVSFVTFV